MKYSMTFALAFMLAGTALTPTFVYAEAGQKAEEGEHAEEAKGPHGGRLLKDGNFAVELTIFETNVEPEFRIYAYYDKKPLLPSEVGVSVQLTRLGGKKDLFSFKPEKDYLRGQALVAEPHSFDVAVGANYKGKTYRWSYPSYEGRVTITQASAKSAGVITGQAGPATLKETVTLNGNLAFQPTSLAKISARYPGMVRKLHVSLGDKVKRGQTVATVESNISLSGYSVTSPINGIVVEQGASVGEATGDKPLMVVADPSKLRATLQSFPADGKRVKAGQHVTLSSLAEQHTISGTIAGVVPDPDSATPVMLAFVNLDNSDGHWTAGSAVLAKVEVDSKEVPLAVKTSGLQPFRDFTVVFAKVGNEYEVRMLELGLKDATHAEVLGGIAAGDTYVTGNSYLIKADIEKSGASHDH